MSARKSDCESPIEGSAASACAAAAAASAQPTPTATIRRATKLSHLIATLGANVLVAIGTWLAFEALGMEQAGVWGLTAGILHFIPYLGPVLFAIASGMAAFMQFGTVPDALAVAGVSRLVATAIGSLILTWLQSRFARVNAAVLFIALLFFGWLWGIPGLLLGAPLIAITKVVCDRVESLTRVGELLGH